MFESRHSDYLKEAEKSHFQGQYLEGAIFLWNLDLCRVYVEFMSGLCIIHAGFMYNPCGIFVQPSFDFFLQQNFVCDIMEKKQKDLN